MYAVNLAICSTTLQYLFSETLRDLYRVFGTFSIRFLSDSCGPGAERMGT
jgi:hypothetical protein